MMILAEINLFPILLVVGFILMINIVAALRCYKKCGPDEALIRTGLGGARVSFDHGLVVVPVAQRFEIIKVSARNFEIDVPVTTKDENPIILKCFFVLSVNKTADDVLSVLRFCGLERLSEEKLLQKLFEPSFTEAVCQIAKQFSLEDIQSKHYQFSEEAINLIGTDLNGFSFDSFSFSIT